MWHVCTNRATSCSYMAKSAVKNDPLKCKTFQSPSKFPSQGLFTRWMRAINPPDLENLPYRFSCLFPVCELWQGLEGNGCSLASPTLQDMISQSRGWTAQRKCSGGGWGLASGTKGRSGQTYHRSCLKDKWLCSFAGSICWSSDPNWQM